MLISSSGCGDENKTRRKFNQRNILPAKKSQSKLDGFFHVHDMLHLIDTLHLIHSLEAMLVLQNTHAHTLKEA